MPPALLPASIRARKPRRGLTAPLASALLLHGAGLLVLWTAWQSVGHGGATSRPPLVVRLIETMRPSESTSVSPPEPSAAKPAARRRAIPEQRREIIGSRASDTAAVAAAESSPGPALAAPHPRGIDPGSIARASREAARAPSLAQQSNELLAHRPPPSAQQKLASEVASAAKGECLKGGPGGYDKQHYGLLAIPLLVFDAATGQCRD
jgi:hypothetical protein